jgi:monoamine oxidase
MSGKEIPLTMKQLNRRTFLAASAASVATAPAWGAPSPKKAGPRPEQLRSGPPEVVIIGAGAAGIAAARRLVAAGRRVLMLEAGADVGGRCVTDTKTFGVPYDRGANWIYNADVNPLVKLAAPTGLDVYPAPPGQRVRIGRRYARESEMEQLLALIVRTNNSIADAARKGDIACAQVLPRDLGEWRATIEFMLGPYGCGKDLAEVSAVDFTRAPDRYNAALCRQGFGALLAKLAAKLPVQLATPAIDIDWGLRAGVVVATPRGRITASAAIVTASTNVLAAGKIRFDPDLPRRYLDAATKLELGSYDHVALELPDNPLGLRSDELVFEKCTGPRTAAIFANTAESTLCMISVGGGFGRDLSAKGDKEMVAFALDWLTNLYGADMTKAVKRSHVTRWNQEPWVLGGFSTAAPGGQPARRTLQEPLRNRIWFAGEATHETQWGTVNGAWESGERAADAALRMLVRR